MIRPPVKPRRIEQLETPAAFHKAMVILRAQRLAPKTKCGRIRRRPMPASSK
jgi:hypothetical protein